MRGQENAANHGAGKSSKKSRGNGLRKGHGVIFRFAPRLTGALLLVKSPPALIFFVHSVVDSDKVMEKIVYLEPANESFSSIIRDPNQKNSHQPEFLRPLHNKPEDVSWNTFST
ncbi:MAG TPA: hypothetical protein VM532_13730, partial [Burkholderiales bacterium]|nr:hypothetical protein [Burkholderiales bacterium]